MHFLHDVHLGYQQYGLKDRFNDFSRAFLYLVDTACDQTVDFVLLAGNLFHKRTVDPLAMRVAIVGLEQLQSAGIPVLAVEGNHEKAYYRDQFSWVDFLDAMGYLRLLNPTFKQGRPILEPHGDEGGAYVDLLRELPALSKGQALIAGAAVNMPVLCRVRRRLTEHGAEDVDAPARWVDWWEHSALGDLDRDSALPAEPERCGRNKLFKT